jgi:hypothetical protein
MQGMGVPADSLPETVLYTDFLQRVMVGPHLTRESLRTPCWPLMLQLSPLQEHTADELVIQDLGLEASVQRNSTLNSLLTQ